MDFDFTERGPKLPKAHFTTLRDRLPALVPYMNNAVGAEVRSVTTDAAGIVYREALWRGSMEAVPSMFRPMLREEMLVWLERTTWREDDLTAAWAMHLPGMPQLFTAQGHFTLYEADDGGTSVDIQGEFNVHAQAVSQLAPGVPTPLLAALVPRVEQFVVKLLDPNLREQHRAVHLLLDLEG